MTNKDQLYNWDFLEQYVQRRLLGDFDDTLESLINEDEFLQTTIEGFEAKLLANKGIGLHQDMENKKIKLWKKLSVLAPVDLPSYETKEIVVEETNTTYRLGQNIKAAWEELKYAQFQYVLGFNFSCILVILVFCLWTNHAQESANFLSQVEMPGGFKP